MNRARLPWARRILRRTCLLGIPATASILCIFAVSAAARPQDAKKPGEPRLAAPTAAAVNQSATSPAVTTANGDASASTASPQQDSPAESSAKEPGADKAVVPLEGTKSGANPNDPDEEDDDGDTGSSANLTVRVDANGTAEVSFFAYGGTGAALANLTEGFEKTLGCPLHSVSGTKRSFVQDQAEHCRLAVRRSGLRYDGKLDLTPLFEPLRQANINLLSVSIIQTGGIPLECSPRSPLPALRSNQTSLCGYSILLSPPAAAPGADSLALSKSKYFQTPETLPGIELSYGMARAEIVRMGAVLGFVLLLPILVTLWMRRAALRAAERIAAGLRTADATSGRAGSVHDDRAGIWFGYWKSLNWVQSASLFLWWGASDTLNLSGLLAIVFRPGGSGNAAWAFRLVDHIGFWLPPLFVVVICQALSHPVQVHVRGLQWTRGEVLRQSIWSVAAGWLPLLLFFSGVNEMWAGSSRLGMLWIVAAFFGRTYAARQSALAQGLTPRALTAGELRDSTFAMATKLKVKLLQVYVIATGKARMANAFASNKNSILLTDALLGSLNRREVDAVVAHELAHLKHDHPNKLGMAWTLGFMAAIAILVFAPTGGMLRPLRYLIVLVVPQACVYFFSRRFEYTADKEAVLLTGDAEAQITSLVKIHRLNLMPLDWGRVQGKFLTHPSTRNRARAMARVGGIPEERVPEILEQALLDPGPAPAAAPDGMLSPSLGSATAPGVLAEYEGADHGSSQVEPARLATPEFRPATPAQPPVLSPVAGGILAKDLTHTSDSRAREASRNAAVATLEAPAQAVPSPVPADRAPEMPEGNTKTASAPAADQYSLPASAGGEEKVFSSTYKHRNAFRNVWIFISSLVFPPAVVALGVQHAHLTGGLRWGAYAAGWMVTLAISMAVRERLLSWEAPKLRRELRAKMEKAGLDPVAWGGRFVGFSPHAAPRSYESMSVWDIGYLFVYQDRICYWGEEARFALRRNQITAVRLAAGPPGWFYPKNIYISWRDGENFGTFNMRVGDVSNNREMARQTQTLGERLQSWFERPPLHRNIPPALAKLGAPQLGAVTGTSPRAKPKSVFATSILLLFVGWAVSVLLGLPVLGITYPLMYLTLLMSSAATSSAVRHTLSATMPAAPGWHVILTAWTIFLIQLIPNLLYRDPKSPNVTPPSS
jgi:Zn-dependent protease with chaperone function